MDNTTKAVWTAPTLTEIGSVAELTRQAKFTGADDGFTANGQTIGDPVTPS